MNDSEKSEKCYYCDRRISKIATFFHTEIDSYPVGKCCEARELARRTEKFEKKCPECKNFFWTTEEENTGYCDYCSYSTSLVYSMRT